MNEQWMKLVPNMIYSRKIEFSFWVRLVPVRGVHTQEPQARAPRTAHFGHSLHICTFATTFGKGKGFYSFSSRVPIVKRS